MNPNSPNFHLVHKFPSNNNFSQQSLDSNSQESPNPHSQNIQYPPHQYQNYFIPNNSYMGPSYYPHQSQISSDGVGPMYSPYQSYMPIPGSASRNSQNSMDQSPNMPKNVHNVDEGKSYAKWSTQENLNLISCWLEVSKDAIVGTDQTNAKLWDRIAVLYNQNDKSGKYRDGNKAKSHWNRMSRNIQSFSAKYNRVKQRQQSGSNEDDVIRDAYLLYESSNDGKSFQYVNEWRILKNEPKWLSVWGAKDNDDAEGVKRARVNESGSYVSSEASDSNPINLEELQEPDRPSGIKAAKRKGKQKASSSDGTTKNNFISKEEWENNNRKKDEKIEALEKLIFQHISRKEISDEKKWQMKKEKMDRDIEVKRIRAQAAKEKTDGMLQIEKEKAAAELDLKFLSLDISLLPPDEQEMAAKKKSSIMRKLFS